MLRPIPSVALLPLSLLIFGFGYRMEIAVIAFATFWPSLILTQSAVAQIEPRLIEVARLLGLTRLQTAWKIVLPAAAPRLMTGLRLAAGLRAGRRGDGGDRQQPAGPRPRPDDRPGDAAAGAHVRRAVLGRPASAGARTRRCCGSSAGCSPIAARSTRASPHDARAVPASRARAGGPRRS